MMTQPQQPSVRAQIFYWLGILAVVVGVTLAVVNYINKPVEALDIRIDAIEKGYVEKKDFARLEAKVNELLIKNGINPSKFDVQTTSE